MKTGIVFNTFFAKNGKKVVLRTLKWEDLDDNVELINSLVDEGAEINNYQKVTRESEADWMGEQLVEIEKYNRFVLVAEVDGKVVANSRIMRGRGYTCYEGILGIAIKKGYRDLGIGTELIRILILQAEEMNLKILTLTVFSTNKRAIHVYQKLGFKESGIIPNNIFKDGKFIDIIIMFKELTSISPA